MATDVESQTDLPEEVNTPVWVKPLPSGVPPTAFWGEDDLLYHRIDMMTEGGTVHKGVVRRLAQSLEEAREMRLDYFHPTLGLIWEGYKLARDRSPEDRVRDTTMSRIRPGVTSPFGE